MKRNMRVARAHRLRSCAALLFAIVAPLAGGPLGARVAQAAGPQIVWQLSARSFNPANGLDQVSTTFTPSTSVYVVEVALKSSDGSDEAYIELGTNTSDVTQVSAGEDRVFVATHLTPGTVPPFRIVPDPKHDYGGRSLTVAAAVYALPTLPLTAGGTATSSVPNFLAGIAPSAGTDAVHYTLSSGSARIVVVSGDHKQQDSGRISGEGDFTVTLSPGLFAIALEQSPDAGTSMDWHLTVGASSSVAGATAATTATPRTTPATLNVAASIAALSCPSVTFCAGAGAGGSIAVTSDAGAGWTTVKTGAGKALLGISCASSRRCVAVGKGGTIVASSSATAWAAQRSPVTAQLNGVSCGPAACVAVGAAGAIVTTGDWGKTWTARASGTTRDLKAVSCADTLRCVAVGDYAGNTPAVALTTGNGGRTWNVRSSGIAHALYGVSCPSAAMCVAAGQHGHIVVTHDGGTTWHERSTSTDAYLESVSCPSTSRCVAVGFYVATMDVTPGMWSIEVSKDGGATWSGPAPASADGALYGEVLTHAVSCPTSLTCFAAGHDFLVTRDGGSTWRRVG